MISIIDPNNRDYDFCHNRAALALCLIHIDEFAEDESKIFCHFNQWVAVVEAFISSWIQHMYSLAGNIKC